MRKLAPVALLLLSLTGVSTQQTCFYINGQEAKFPNGAGAPTNFPCDPDAAESVCCSGEVGSVCLSNKLCVGPNGNTARGSCTDATWSSPECPHYCMGADRGGTDLISCANVTGTDTSYCCDGHRAFCCDEGVARFDVFPSNPEVVARWDPTASQFVPVRRSTSSSASEQATHPSTSDPPVTTDTTKSSPSPSQTGTTTDQNRNQSTNPEPQDDSSGATLSTGAQAGIAVGATALAAALAAVVFLVVQLRKKKAHLAELEKQQQQQQGAYKGGGDGGGGLYGWGGQYQYYGPPVELSGVARTQEMDGVGARFELGSDGLSRPEGPRGQGL